MFCYNYIKFFFCSVYIVCFKTLFFINYNKHAALHFCLNRLWFKLFSKFNSALYIHFNTYLFDI